MTPQVVMEPSKSAFARMIGVFTDPKETFVVKVAGVKRVEAGGLLLKLRTALEGTGYEAVEA